MKMPSYEPYLFRSRLLINLSVTTESSSSGSASVTLVSPTRTCFLILPPIRFSWLYPEILMIVPSMFLRSRAPLREIFRLRCMSSCSLRHSTTSPLPYVTRREKIRLSVNEKDTIFNYIFDSFEWCMRGKEWTFYWIKEEIKINIPTVQYFHYLFWFRNSVVRPKHV